MHQRIPRVHAHRLSTSQLTARLSEYQRVLHMLEGYTSRDAGELRRIIRDVIRDIENEYRRRKKKQEGPGERAARH